MALLKEVWNPVFQHLYYRMEYSVFDLDIVSFWIGACCTARTFKGSDFSLLSQTKSHKRQNVCTATLLQSCYNRQMLYIVFERKGLANKNLIDFGPVVKIFFKCEKLIIIQLLCSMYL